MAIFSRFAPFQAVLEALRRSAKPRSRFRCSARSSTEISGALKKDWPSKKRASLARSHLKPSKKLINACTKTTRNSAEKL